MSSVRSALAGYFGSAAGGGTPTHGHGQGGGFSSESSSISAVESQSIGEIVQLRDGSSYKIIKLIAEGGFSYVFLAEKINSGQFIAIKKILSPDSTALTTIQEEVTLLKSLQHRNIVHYIGYYKANLENYILMEYCSSLPLPSAISAGKEELIGNIFLQCCSAIEYMHNQKIIHRDVKLENFLIGQDGHVKLVDFGSATREFITPTVDWSAAQRCRVEEAIYEKTTPMYRPPEVLDLWLNYSIDTRLDLWALGCLLYLLDFGTHPFPDSNKLAIINAKYNITKEDSFTPVIRGLLQPDPSDRMSFQQIYDGLAHFQISKLKFKPPIVHPPPVVSDNRQYSQSSNSSGVGSTIASTSSSLFSSLKGGAESLFKNIRENFKTPGEAGNGSPSATPPRRPSIPVGFEGNRDFAPSAPPPPRPSQPPPRPIAPKPIKRQDIGTRDGIPESHTQPDSLPPPLPEKPIIKEERQMFVDNLLDLEDFGGGSSGTPVHIGQPQCKEFEQAFTQGSVNLLDDLFGGTPSTTLTNVNQPAPNVDLLGSVSCGIDSLYGNKTRSSPIVFGEYSKPEPKPTVPAVILQKKSNNLLDDLFGDALANAKSMDAPGQLVENAGSTAGHIPSSSSFGSLFQLKPERAATSSMTKNVSTPNLTELIFDDKKAQEPNEPAPPSKPNYNRAVFEIETNTNPNTKKNNLNDVFGEFLKSEGFSSTNTNGKNQTINDLRRVEMVRDSQDPIQLKISLWREGKKKNIRALLSSLHTITWDGCNWIEVSMSQMISEAQVKKIYRKACLCIHPDKQVGSEYELLAKAIFIELNEAWTAFEAEKS